MISISYRAAGSGSYEPLDASGLHPLYSGFRPPMKADPDIQKRYGSEAPLVRATGNRVYTVTFISNTTHASLDAALLYLLSQLEDIPDTIDLQIIQGGTTYYFPACVFTAFDPEEPTGISNIIRYTFTAGSFTSTAP